jgi:hypothetical protein
MPVILLTWEAEIGRIKIQGQQRQIVLVMPISKITRAKWTGGVTQAVEHLLCQHEALNSNPSPTKNNHKTTLISPLMEGHYNHSKEMWKFNEKRYFEVPCTNRVAFILLF